MAIAKIEQYRQKNGVDILKVFLTPTKAFPNGGYFYTPAEAIDLVQSRGWYLVRHGNAIDVYSKYLGKKQLFHRELYKFYNGCYTPYIDHINNCEFDNTDENLNKVSNQQNQYNRLCRGYMVQKDKHFYTYFVCNLTLNGKPYRFKSKCKEDEACVLRRELETNWLKEMMQDEYYMFDFKKYRRGSEKLLDLERTGVVSEEEAIYKHILGYSENAWYYLRFGLQEYFKEYNIPVPKYQLDSDGFMIYPITGQRLCPL